MKFWYLKTSVTVTSGPIVGPGHIFVVGEEPEYQYD